MVLSLSQRTNQGLIGQFQLLQLEQLAKSPGTDIMRINVTRLLRLEQLATGTDIMRIIFKIIFKTVSFIGSESRVKFVF